MGIFQPLQEVMENSQRPTPGNVIALDSKIKDCRDLVAPVTAVEPGSKDDPRMKEAMVLMEAFLAIDDEVARNALVSLAQQLVSYDWARRASGR